MQDDDEKQNRRMLLRLPVLLLRLVDQHDPPPFASSTPVAKRLMSWKETRMSPSNPRVAGLLQPPLANALLATTPLPREALLSLLHSSATPLHIH